MSAPIMSFCAASCASLSNIFFRKNTIARHTSNHSYLVWFYLISLISSLSFYPQVFTHTPNFFVVAMGALAGALNIFLMNLTSKALEKGPSGIVFAFQNAGSIFPNPILYLIFGSSFGFLVTPLQIVGLTFVLIGLYMGSKGEPLHGRFSSGWFKYAVGCFLIQVVILCLFQWRVLLYSSHPYSHLLVPYTFGLMDDVWFMPGLFGTALIIQVFFFILEKRKMQKEEILLGSLSGVANGFSTCFLLLATKWASPLQKGLIFPFFTVGIIALSSLISYRYYKEHVDFKAIIICSLGVIVASLG